MSYNLTVCKVIFFLKEDLLQKRGQMSTAGIESFQKCNKWIHPDVQKIYM